MASMASSRRLLRAGLLTLTAWLLLGTTIGVVQAADGDQPVQSFIMPTVKLGDRVTYDQVTEDDDGVERAPLAVSWERRGPLLLPDGQWHEIESLRYDLGDLTEADTTDTFDAVRGSGVREYEAGTHQLQAITAVVDGEGQDGSDFLGPLQVQSTTLSAGVEMTIFFPDFMGTDADVPDCFFAGVWGGQEIRSDGDLRLPPCFSQAPVLGGLTLHGKGVETIAGVEALRFHGRQTRDVSAFSPVGGVIANELDLWLSPAAPYPLRVVASSSFFGEREAITMDLTGFEAGSAERVAVAPRDAAPKPELRQTSFDGLLPFSDADTSLPFPLSRALESARGDSRVAEFLADNPQAYAVAAGFREIATMGQPQRTWVFVLADGNDGLQVEVTQDQPGGSAVPAALAPMARLDRVASVEDVDGDAPSRDGLPAELPTMGSLLQRWAWQRDVPADGQSWSYDLRTGGEELAQLIAGGQLVMVGRTAMTLEPGVGAGGATITESGTYDWVAYDMAGEPFVLMGVQADKSQVYGPGGTMPPTSSGIAPLATVTTTLGWLPTPAQAAGAGLIAILVGALYFLWPKLKALAFAGLFSRLLPSELLDHPGRARLLEIVRAEPGIHFQELVRRSGLASGTAVHHLNKLARGNLIACRPLGRYTCYFPGATPDRASLLAAPVLRSEGARLVFETIVGSPHLSGLELAGRTGLQQSTVNYHVQRLIEAGLVAGQRDGRAVRLRAVGVTSPTSRPTAGAGVAA